MVVLDQTHHTVLLIVLISPTDELPSEDYSNWPGWQHNANIIVLVSKQFWYEASFCYYVQLDNT